MPNGIRNRGFASMDAAKQREIARKGGRAAHARGTAHEFNVNEARAAGRKGGESVSANRDHMSRIGRIGGKNSAGRRAAKSTPVQENGQSILPDAEGASARPDQAAGGAGTSADAKLNPDVGNAAESTESEGAGDTGFAAA